MEKEHQKAFTFDKNGKLDYSPDEFCYFCDWSEIQLHHIIRKKDGGTNEDDNLLPLCRFCHRLLHKREYFLQFSKGYFLMINRQDPTLVRFPNSRQINRLRECPFNSLKKGIENRKLNIKERKI